MSGKQRVTDDATGAAATPRPLPDPKPATRPLSYLATAAAMGLWVVARETWAAIAFRLRRWRRG